MRKLNLVISLGLKLEVGGETIQHNFNNLQYILFHFAVVLLSFRFNPESRQSLLLAHFLTILFSSAQFLNVYDSDIWSLNTFVTLFRPSYE